VHTPFFHTGAYNVTCLPLLRLGGRIVLSKGFAADSILDTLERERVTVFFAVPTMFQMLAARPGFHTADLGALRFCISGGAACPLALISRYRERGILLRQGFGLTEVGPNCFYMFEQEARERPDSVGLPMPHSQVRLLDDQGNEVLEGLGELCIAGPHLCSGYWNRPEAFGTVCKEGFFHTGDLMRRDSAGFFYAVGRKKEMYISGGENVYPGEVLRAILQHPAVEDALVLPVPHPHWGEVGFAFVMASQPLSLEQLRGFLNPLISRYKHPHYLKVLPSFPLLSNGKVDRRALQTLALEAADGS
jgi:fatty-acyl-CoA synthase